MGGVSIAELADRGELGAGQDTISTGLQNWKDRSSEDSLRAMQKGNGGAVLFLQASPSLSPFRAV